jgi:hypothetical protein
MLPENSRLKHIPSVILSPVTAGERPLRLIRKCSCFILRNDAADPYGLNPMTGRPSKARLLLFAFGDFAFNLFWQSIMLFLLFYYTDALHGLQRAGLRDT